LGLGVLGELLGQPVLHFAHAGNTAPANPELRMEYAQQRNQDGGDEAVSHVQAGL
jgi:hypothetical protein